MKRNCRALLLLAVALAPGCASDDPAALTSAARKGIFPATLASHDSALEYMRQSYIRGRVDRVQLGLTSYLVMFQHGSGIPVTGIAVYRREGLKWKLVAEPRPPVTGFLSAASADGRIVAREEHTGRTWTLYDPGAQKL